MESNGTLNLFDSLPQKAKQKIFESFPQEKRERLRSVCRSWNQFISEEYPIQIVITNSNFERLFRCPRATQVTLSSLSTEYLGEIAFSQSLKSLKSAGKVLTSNLRRIFLACDKLESLSFMSLQQVVSIDIETRITLPAVKEIEIKVRSDQESFTVDEIILLNFLKSIQFGCLENILISVRTALEWLAEQIREEGPPEDPSISLTGWGSDQTMSMGSLAQTSLQVHPSVVGRFGDPETMPPMMMDASTNSEQNGTSSVFLPPNIASMQHESPPVNSSTTPTTPPPARNAHTIPLINVDNAISAASGSDSDAFSNYQPEMSQFDLGRFFNARIHAQINASGASLRSILSDPRSRDEFLRVYDFRGSNRPAAAASSPFFQLLKNNASTIKKLIVNARPSFMCFGNVTALPVEQIQFQELEYSFGRSQLCMEYPLLQAQSNLVKVSLQIIEDLWSSLLMAVTQSKNTLQEIDLKILSLSREPLDLRELSFCTHLVMLKLFHYYEKRSLETLPTSLTTLILNGPLSVEEIKSMAVRLQNLQELTIIANMEGGNIDLQLFQQLVAMKKITKIMLIQCRVSVEDIVRFSGAHPSNLTVRVLGPLIIPDEDLLGSQIQFVVINITEPVPISTQ